MTGISVVIVTYRRPAGLATVLDALAEQSRPPTEILVIDNAPDHSEAREVCERVDRRLPVRYLPHPQNSLPAARNIGVRTATGTFVALLDDDVRIGADYLRTTVGFLEADPTVVGVQGYIPVTSQSPLREWIHRAFSLYHHEADRCRVMASISTTYPAPLTRAVTCEWLSGTNQVYRREALVTIPWDEQLRRYADGEDLDHSFRVSRRHPAGLAITPAAIVYHDEAPGGRTTGFDLIAMRELYGWYLLHKLFPRSAGARATYLWSRIGRTLIGIGVAGTRRRPGGTQELIDLVRAFALVWRHRTDLRNGRLDRVNAAMKW